MRFMLYAGLLIVAATIGFTTTLYFLDEVTVCSNTQDGKMVLAGVFKRNGAFGYTKALTNMGPFDDSSHPRRSGLVLCENKTLLGPSHSPHAKIRDVGKGAFSHWDGNLYFSSSDNSDPNTNGHTYRVIKTVVLSDDR